MHEPSWGLGPISVIALLVCNFQAISCHGASHCWEEAKPAPFRRPHDVPTMEQVMCWQHLAVPTDALILACNLKTVTNDCTLCASIEVLKRAVR